MPIVWCIKSMLAAVPCLSRGVCMSRNNLLQAQLPSAPTCDTRSLSVLNVKRCRLVGRSPTSSSESDMVRVTAVVSPAVCSRGREAPGVRASTSRASACAAEQAWLALSRGVTSNVCRCSEGGETRPPAHAHYFPANRQSTYFGTASCINFMAVQSCRDGVTTRDWTRASTAVSSQAMLRSHDTGGALGRRDAAAAGGPPRHHSWQQLEHCVAADAIVRLSSFQLPCRCMQP